MTTSRIEALGDGIFAIAMTILVLEIHVPVIDNANSRKLLHVLRELAPHVAGYIVSFLILGTLWIGHHNHFVYIRRADRLLLWLNIGFLCSIAFLPFSTALLGAYSNQPVAAALYGSNLLAAGGFLWGHWVYATRGRRLVAADLSDDLVRMARRRVEWGILVYASAIGVAFVSMPISLVLFALMPIVYIIPGKVDRHIASTAEKERPAHRERGSRNPTPRS
jgi:uncharacterized membrane protein